MKLFLVALWLLVGWAQTWGDGLLPVRAGSGGLATSLVRYKVLPRYTSTQELSAVQTEQRWPPGVSRAHQNGSYAPYRDMATGLLFSTQDMGMQVGQGDAWVVVPILTLADGTPYLHPRAVSVGEVAVPAAVAEAEPSPAEAQPVSQASERSGYATYYHPSLSGSLMANGEPYRRRDPTVAASTDYPLGTALVVSYTRVLTVVVSDRGKLGTGQLDLSEAGFEALAGTLRPGHIDVMISEVGGRW